MSSKILQNFTSLGVFPHFLMKKINNLKLFNLGTSLVVQWEETPFQGAWVPSLIRELRSYLPSGVATTTTKKTEKSFNLFYTIVSSIVNYIRKFQLVTLIMNLLSAALYYYCRPYCKIR